MNVYYAKILFTDKETILCNYNHTNFGVLFYEHIYQPFRLYHFYRIFLAVFDSFNQKILPILLKGFNDTDKNKKYTYKIFKEKVIEKYLKLSADLTYQYIYYINKRVDRCIFEHIFVFYKKHFDYASPNLELAAES